MYPLTLSKTLPHRLTCIQSQSISRQPQHHCPQHSTWYTAARTDIGGYYYYYQGLSLVLHSTKPGPHRPAHNGTVFLCSSACHSPSQDWRTRAVDLWPSRLARVKWEQLCVEGALWTGEKRRTGEEITLRRCAYVCIVVQRRHRSKQLKMTSDVLDHSFDFLRGKIKCVQWLSPSSILIAVVLAFGSRFALKWCHRRRKIRALATKRKQKAEQCRKAFRNLEDKLRTAGKVRIYTIAIVYKYFWVPRTDRLLSLYIFYFFIVLELDYYILE